MFLPEELAFHHYFFIAAILVLAIIYINELVFEKSNSLRQCVNVPNAISYSYNEIDGPKYWENLFKSASGRRQSPINILDNLAKIIPYDSAPVLFFSEEFHVYPKEMKLHNNCHSIVMYATWDNNKRPSIIGGPLAESYRLVNLLFRWGANDKEGSEHMINSVRYTMELQAAFIKSSSCDEDIVTAASKGSLVMLSYLYLVTPTDNPYLEPIISALKYLKNPMSYLCIDAIILSLLMPDFSRDYYTYVGSLSFPPCTEDVLWIVKPEPLMISSRQVKQFRKIEGYCGKVTNNTRYVQNVNNRKINYYQ